jgi:arylsulfatase A-like enzyme
MVESVDESVGRVLAALDKADVSSQTLVIFTSDNGGFWNATSNLPLRASKGAYYEGGIRVPLLIRVPGMTVAGNTSDSPAIGMDLYPTCLAAAGLPPLPNQHVDGLILHRCSVVLQSPNDRSSGTIRTTTNIPPAFPAV